MWPAATDLLDDGSAGRVARMVTCWRTLAETREMLLHGATELTTSYREECDVAARVEGDVTEQPEEYHSFSWPCGQQSRPKKRYYAEARDPARRGNPLLRRTGSTAGPVLLIEDHPGDWRNPSSP
jgi:hypothetical protein